MSLDKMNALKRFDDIAACLHGRRAVVFLDFDGTLAPIVSRPERATIDSATRAAVTRLARVCPVALVSGRDLEDVRERADIDGIWYAGSHGFDIAGPHGIRHEHPRGIEALPTLDAAEQALRAALKDIEGALVERKRFSIAAHYRLTPERDAPAVERAVDAISSTHAGLRKGEGKKVFELQPDVDWNKGAAVHWLLSALGLDSRDVLPIYVGDDVTDEDAFRALTDRGLGIAVLDHPRPTAAPYQLRDPGEVRAFLERLAQVLEKPSGPA